VQGDVLVFGRAGFSWFLDSLRLVPGGHSFSCAVRSNKTGALALRTNALFRSSTKPGRPPRNRTRSALTMLRHSLGNRHRHAPDRLRRRFRQILVSGFAPSAKAQSSAGRSRPVTARRPARGQKVVFEKAASTWSGNCELRQHACLETVRRPGIAYGNGWSEPAAVRGVCPNTARCATKKPPSRWINSLDELERRRVVFLGARVREQLFGGRPQWARPS